MITLDHISRTYFSTYQVLSPCMFLLSNITFQNNRSILCLTGFNFRREKLDFAKRSNQQFAAISQPHLSEPETTDYPNKIVCQEGRITNQNHGVRRPANDIYSNRISTSISAPICDILFHWYRYLVCKAAYEVLEKTTNVNRNSIQKISVNECYLSPRVS